MNTLLSETRRHAAHGQHRCRVCLRPIAARELYLDQRIAGDGTAWTFRMHLTCSDAISAWGPDDGDSWFITDYSDGHLPPCPRAWPNREAEPCACKPTAQASITPGTSSPPTSDGGQAAPCK